MVSIITSLYKSEKYLPEFVKQLEAFANGLTKDNFSFELIVIANNPSAEELAAFKRFENLSWFSFVSISRESLYATWNRGVSLAKGDAIGFWNVDDIRYPEAVKEAAGLIQQGAELVYFPFKINRFIKFFGHDFLVYKKVIKNIIPEFNDQTKNGFLYQMNCGPFFMFSKQLYSKVGPFDEQFKIAGDFDWCARAAKVSQKLVKAKSLGGEFRVDGGGLSAGWSQKQRAENNVVYIRQGFNKKIIPVDESMAKMYNPNVVKIGSKEIPYV